MSDEPVRKVVFCASKSPSPTEPVAKKPQRKKKQNAAQQDIYEIHERILEILDNEYKELPDLNKKLNRLEWISKNGDPFIERCQASEEMHKLQSKIQLIVSGIREAKYRLATEQLLIDYTNLLKKPVRVNFMGGNLSENLDQKNQILAEFLNIAKDYTNVQPIDNLRASVLCEDCKVELQREDDFLFVCPLCGFAMKHFASVASYQENARINIAQRYVYDKRAHFGDSIKKFQANQNTTISEKVYSDLWDKINIHELPIDKLTKDHLYEFLKLTGHSDHYEDVTLIFCELTGKTAPNISHLEQQLYTLFDQIDPVYEQVKPPERVNFLNGQFVLFKLLQKLKYPCREEDFYILKTRDKMLEHDQIWKKICEELNWQFISTV
jgi:hypothetical protein